MAKDKKIFKELVEFPFMPAIIDRRLKESEETLTDTLIDKVPLRFLKDFLDENKEIKIKILLNISKSIIRCIIMKYFMDCWIQVSYSLMKI